MNLHQTKAMLLRSGLSAFVAAACLLTMACDTFKGPGQRTSTSLYKAMNDPSCVTRDVTLPKEYDHASSDKQSLRLTLVNVKTPTAADTSYRVFLNKPDATGTTPATDPHCVGSISFFGSAPENDFVLDAGRTLDGLRQKAAYKAAEKVTVTLVPVDGGEPVQLEQMQLVIPNR